MAKDPAFLFYPNDFSSGTQFFSDEQVGKYIRLLMAQHQHGHLPENHMIFICKSYDKDIFSKFVQDSEGRWYNERLEIELDKRKNYISSRSKNKEGKTKEKIISKSYENHMVNENENINDNKKEWAEWGRMIVDQQDHQWDAIRGRKVSEAEMDAFLSVATRNQWAMKTQNEFRISLKGFKLNGKQTAQPNHGLIV